MDNNTATPADGSPVTKGNGKAVHALVNMYSGPATRCDKWGHNGAYGSRIRTATGPVTCKRCVKLAA